MIWHSLCTVVVGGSLVATLATVASCAGSLAPPPSAPPDREPPPDDRGTASALLQQQRWCVDPERVVRLATSRAHSLGCPVGLLPRADELDGLERHLAPRPQGIVLRAVVLDRSLTRLERKKTGSPNCCYSWQLGRAKDPRR